MFLVTGATGNVGREVAVALAAAGHPVRALVRDPDSAVPGGVEPVEGDLARPAPLGPALAGVDGVFLLPGYAAGTDLLPRIEEAGVQTVVQLSSSAAASGDDSNAITSYMIASERAVTTSALWWTVLRPFGFMSNTLRWVDELRSGDVVREPFPDVAVAMVDPADIGEVAALALVEEGHNRQTYVLSGPDPLLPGDRLAALGRALGRELTLDGLDPAEARDELFRTMPEAYAAAMLDYFAEGNLDESTPDPTVSRLLGRPARRFETWLTEHVHEFG